MKRYCFLHVLTIVSTVLVLSSCAKDIVPDPSEIVNSSKTENKSVSVSDLTGQTGEDESEYTWTCTYASTQKNGNVDKESFVGSTLTLSSTHNYISGIALFGEEGQWSLSGTTLTLICEPDLRYRAHVSVSNGTMSMTGESFEGDITFSYKFQR